MSSLHSETLRLSPILKTAQARVGLMGFLVRRRPAPAVGEEIEFEEADALVPVTNPPRNPVLGSRTSVRPRPIKPWDSGWQFSTGLWPDLSAAAGLAPSFAACRR